MPQNNTHTLPRLIILTILALEVILLYAIPRSNFVTTFSLFTGLFLLYVYIVKSESLLSFRDCIGLAILLRLVAIFSMPVLSDDYLRFIWDGEMILRHVNPYQFTPLDFIHTHNVTPYLQHLYNAMNSQEYHTIYPPILQFIFTLSALTGGFSDYLPVIIMKLFIFAAELGTIRILYLLAKSYNIPERQILWYVLNPLIIVELTGNVHFEAILIFFFVCFLHYLNKNKIAAAAVFWMLAVCTKMIPLMLAPLIIRHLGLKRSILFGSIAAAIGVLLFLPFFNWHLVKDIGASLHLFFHLFEFNASVFYFIRWIGYFYVDYDIIEEVTPVLTIVSFILILALSFWRTKRYSFIERSLWIFSIYFLLSTMVHPWYASTLILLSAFSRFRYPIVFSLLIMLSYYPYSMKEYNEETGLWWIIVEYGLLFAYIAWEILFLRKRLNDLGTKEVTNDPADHRASY